MGHWITLVTAHGQVCAWHAQPDDAPRAGLVIIQEIFGVTAYIREVAEHYAAQGYAVLAPALFDPIEKDVQLTYDQDGIHKGLELVGALGFERALDIVQAAAQALAPAGKVGTLGYCWGGSVALLAALRLGLPSVSYYGGRNTQFLDETPKAPVLFHFGAHDQSIPAEAVQQHREKLPQMQTFVYPAGHGFDRHVDPHHHDPDSAERARERSLTFLAEHLS
ncbi:dienelactone hydrolase family protein [Xanthomonas sp. MUS 060]|uniref:dienelactone hydrolase family protein n=1 Tax=Xanthomonas sp. MUS 060 TaxID=1588031 RepID=UPI0005F2CDC5|nr:dienelactone hydrolase family protein [Xanthomonas sp. MUS 060]